MSKDTDELLELQAEYAELRRRDTRELALSMTRNEVLKQNRTVMQSWSGSDGSSTVNPVNVEDSEEKV